MTTPPTTLHDDDKVPADTSAAIEIEEVCACGSRIRVVDADALALLAVEFWAERHKGHGWLEAIRRKESTR
jgi:hypothetical protein